MAINQFFMESPYCIYTSIDIKFQVTNVMILTAFCNVKVFYFLRQKEKAAYDL